MRRWSGGRKLVLHRQLDRDGQVQLIQVHRLAQHIERPDIQCRLEQGFFLAGGQHDDPDRRIGLSDAPQHLNPIDPRHVDIEQDQIGRVGADQVQRLFAAYSRSDLVATAAEKFPTISPISGSSSTMRIEARLFALLREGWIAGARDGWGDWPG